MTMTNVHGEYLEDFLNNHSVELYGKIPLFSNQFYALMETVNIDTLSNKQYLIIGEISGKLQILCFNDNFLFLYLVDSSDFEKAYLDTYHILPFEKIDYPVCSPESGFYSDSIKKSYAPLNFSE